MGEVHVQELSHELLQKPPGNQRWKIASLDENGLSMNDEYIE